MPKKSALGRELQRLIDRPHLISSIGVVYWQTVDEEGNERPFEKGGRIQGAGGKTLEYIDRRRAARLAARTREIRRTIRGRKK